MSGSTYACKEFGERKGLMYLAGKSVLCKYGDYPSNPAIVPVADIHTRLKVYLNGARIFRESEDLALILLIKIVESEGLDQYNFADASCQLLFAL